MVKQRRQAHHWSRDAAVCMLLQVLGGKCNIFSDLPLLNMNHMKTKGIPSQQQVTVQKFAFSDPSFNFNSFSEGKPMIQAPLHTLLCMDRIDSWGQQEGRKGGQPTLAPRYGWHSGQSISQPTFAVLLL